MKKVRIWNEWYAGMCWWGFEPAPFIDEIIPGRWFELRSFQNEDGQTDMWILIIAGAELRVFKYQPIEEDETAEEP